LGDVLGGGANDGPFVCGCIVHLYDFVDVIKLVDTADFEDIAIFE
jgi:hypothetical protein